VKSAKSQLVTGGEWAVVLDFTASGSAKFAAVTATLSQQVSPANECAIVLDGDVLSAPAVQQSITGGEAQIVGSFTRQRAVDLAALISSGALPVRLTVASVTVQR
jgi:preprotein translocase subunit SecD